MEQAPWVMDQLVVAMDEEEKGMNLEHQHIVFARNAGKKYHIKLDFPVPRLNVQNVKL